MNEMIKNSIKIEFVDHNGNKHMFYNEETPHNQVEFIGKSLAEFFKSIGWSETIIDDTLDSMESELNYLKQSQERQILIYCKKERKIEMKNYSPEKHGAVTAIRIFYEKDRQPMAELAFCFGGTGIIEWTNVSQREKYSKGINGYTFFFDERQKNNFESFKR